MEKMFTKVGLFNAFLFSVLFLFAIGCSKDDSPTGPTITNVNGNWSGKTSQTENISFTVSNNSVTTLSIKVVTPSFVQESSVWPSNCKVADNSFSLSIPGSPVMNVSGQFKSNTSSDGTFSIGSTSGTWTATKQ
jgi:hypothetical protein